MGLAHAPAVADHLVAGFPGRVRRHLDGACEIDAGDHGKAPHHRRLAGDGEAVFIVQRRPFDGDGDVAVHQFGFVELRQRDRGALLRLVHADCLERSQRQLLKFFSAGTGLTDQAGCATGRATGASTIGRLISAESTPNSTDSHQIGV